MTHPMEPTAEATAEPARRVGILGRVARWMGSLRHRNRLDRLSEQAHHDALSFHGRGGF